MKISIGKHEVGDNGARPFIIAEVGSNWRTFDDAKNSIALAKNCGADAVKFQAFDHKALYGLESSYLKAWPTGKCTDHPNSLPLDWLPKLKEKAQACDIEFMCSAFSPELVEAVDPYVNAHKVASAELTHVRMLEKLRALGKPVILSTGASGEADIRQALHVLQGQESPDSVGIPNVPVILMYCVSAYPACEVNVETIKELKAKFHLPVGYSDHSNDVLHLPVSAVKEYGACVLEKHFSAHDLDSPDSGHSLGVDQFKRMVQAVRNGNTGRIGATGEERAMMLRHNRRLIATRDIPRGAVLKEGENFGIYRSLKDDTHAFSPWLIEQVNGKVALRDIQAGSGVGPGDV